MKEKIKDIVQRAAIEIIESNNKTYNLSDLILYSSNGLFDSMDLVNFISNLEEALLSELNISIQLAHPSIFSSTNSPFKTIDATTDFIISKL
jgi:hypothetical protein